MDMENIAQLLQTMLSSDNTETDTPFNGESENADGENNGFGDFFSGIDLDMIMKMGEVFSKLQQHDKNVSLLIALKPHMRPENQEKIETAIRLVRIMGLIPHIKDMGLMDKIF
ncbi:MAG: hypothetical protein FWH05_00320 [Oscillospiraceae bacterium]|nr:hypothetical protein [Oscillospiraceae bacterium]